LLQIYLLRALRFSANKTPLLFAGRYLIFPLCKIKRQDDKSTPHASRKYSNTGRQTFMSTVYLKSAGLALIGALLLAACGGASPTRSFSPETETRAQDSRTFTISDATLPFAALAGTTAVTDRWFGVLNGAGYRIEVPQNWNGILVMYAHGYAGTGAALGFTNPSIRRHLIENGYAWAASSYSKNYYDVRAGVEDTNALARNFNAIASQNGRALAAPTKTYIIGHSMGGHISAAAVEQETILMAVNPYRYDGAVPMCGVHGDTELFDYFAAYQLAAQTLAGFGTTSFTDWATIAANVRTAMFTTFSTVPTAEGLKLREAVKNLTGGERPVFLQGYGNSGLQNVVWGTFGGNGTVNGILNRNVLDTNRFVYHLDADMTTQSATEAAFNASIQRVTAVADANRVRTDGLRWIPIVHGRFSVPVVTLHTLGDMYVPFSMQQIYRARAEANGSGNLLVQRAIRAPSHCDFTIAEQIEAFNAMVTWEQTGVKPAGDDVATPATVASPTYGCTFTRNAGGAPEDNPTTVGTRALIAPQLASCS
jgi:pimeloyl-ACP methyl ester carboxylesterase